MEYIEVEFDGPEFEKKPDSSYRERLAAWMLEQSFATGHGDTFEDLLNELAWQIAELLSEKP